MFHTLGEIKNRSSVQEHETDLRIASERQRPAGRRPRDLRHGAGARLDPPALRRRPGRRSSSSPWASTWTASGPAAKADARAAPGPGGRAHHPLRRTPRAAEGRRHPDRRRVHARQRRRLQRAHRRRRRDLGAAGRAAAGPGRSAGRRRARGASRAPSTTTCCRCTTTPPTSASCPSHYESFGLVAVEAMASGVPVVASRVGGLTGTVKDGETGYLIPWLCPEPFAERIELLLDNEPLRTSLGEAAREAVSRYRWENVAGAVLEVYESLTGGAASRQAGQRRELEEAITCLSCPDCSATRSGAANPFDYGEDVSNLPPIGHDGPQNADGDHGPPGRHRLRVLRQHREVVRRGLDRLLRPHDLRRQGHARAGHLRPAARGDPRGGAARGGPRPRRQRGVLPGLGGRLRGAERGAARAPRVAVPHLQAGRRADVGRLPAQLQPQRPPQHRHRRARRAVPGRARPPLLPAARRRRPE